MAPTRIVFFGSPDPAQEVLETLLDSDHTVVGVITQPDKKRGRGSALVPTPVKVTALKEGINVYEPATKSELSECVAKLTADVGVIVAYGKILPVDVLEHFPHGCINVHYSLLPRWRGAAPVERAILEGDRVSGVAIMNMEEGLDTGAVYATRQIDIEDTTTTTSLFASMNSVAGDLLLVVLDSLGTQSPSEQEGEPTYADKLKVDDFYFSATTSAVDVDRKIRAGSLVKGAWTLVGEDRIRITESGRPHKSETPEEEVGTISRAGILTCLMEPLSAQKFRYQENHCLIFLRGPMVWRLKNFRFE